MKGSYYPYRMEDEPVACRLCGRMLGVAFHFTCHVCGAAYCYVHMPDRCSHIRIKAPFLPPSNSIPS